MTMNYEISEALAQALINYLETRPYREVAPFIDHLLKLEPVSKPPTNQE